MSLSQRLIIYFFIVLALFRISCLSNSHKPAYRLSHSVSPLAICDLHSLVNPYKKIEECHNICTTIPQNKGKARITIYKDASDAKGPKTISCEKVRVTQTFTETWTFSQVASPPVYEQLKPTLEECVSLADKRCPGKDCYESPPESLNGEYYYASDHTVVDDYVYLRSVPSMYASYKGQIVNMPGNSALECNYNDYNCSYHKQIYLWGNDLVMGGCPFQPGPTLGCDQWLTDSQMSYVCSDGRFAFESSGSTPMESPCTAVRMSSEGIIYRVEPASAKPGTDYSSQRISLQPDSKLSGDIETLRVLTANSLAHIDSDLCSLECELASVELRTARRQHTLVRTGDGFILLSAKGHGHTCSKVVQCSAVEPFQFCGNPGRILVRCNGRDYYWDPSKSYIVIGESCDRVTQNDTISIHVGNHLYDLDSGLTIKINESSTETFRTRGLIMSQPSLIDFENIGSLKKSWNSEKSRAPNNATRINLSKNIVKHSALSFDSLRFIGGAVSLLQGWVSSIWGVIVTMFIILITCYFGKDIILGMIKKRSYQTEVARYHRAQASEGTIVFL